MSVITLRFFTAAAIGVRRWPTARAFRSPTSISKVLIPGVDAQHGRYLMATVRGAARFLLRGCRRVKMSSSAQADDPVIADLRIFSLTAGHTGWSACADHDTRRMRPCTTLRSLHELRAVSL